MKNVALVIWFAGEPMVATADEVVGLKALQELRDKYEGKLTASLYTGNLFLALFASFCSLLVLLLTDFSVS